MRSTTKILPLSGLLATRLLVPAAGSLQAQITAQITAKQFFACYVPTTGTVYLIKQPGLRSECATRHVQFSWGVGGGATGAMPAVVINDGDGWAATGTFGSGAIPVTGPGVRVMWYPRKAAFRAGSVAGGQWDDVNVGDYSVALGQNTMATGHHSTATGIWSTATGEFSTAIGTATAASAHSAIALGQNTIASGPNSTALGKGTRASDFNSTAMGLSTTASGENSTAMGASTTASGFESTSMGALTTASGDFSTAMGAATTASGGYSSAIGSFASTNGMTGSFVYGDASTSTIVNATTPNSFVVRAAGGFRLRTSPVLTTGCDISGGTAAGDLTCSGTIQSASGGFRFPDNTVQTTAATGGGPASDVVCTGCVGSSDLANAAVLTVNLANAAVTEPKLGPLSNLALSASPAGTNVSNGLRIVNTSPTGRERIDFIDASGSTISAIQVTNASPSELAIFNNRPGASVQIATGGLDRLTVASNGNIGIGGISPSNILTVRQSSVTDPIADAWTVYSSKRWKTNIEPMKGALDRVRRLRGVSFTWKANGKPDIGLIAEEVGEVVPEVVAYEENSRDAKSVDYARLVAVLIEAVKEQQQQLEELRALVKSHTERTEIAGRRR